LAKIVLSIVVCVLMLANGVVAWVLVRMSGSSPDQMARTAGVLSGTLVAGALMALLSYKFVKANEVRFLKALAWGLVVWLGANAAQFKKASAGQQARLGEAYMEGCRKRCLEKVEEVAELAAKVRRPYCEDYCACLKAPALAAVERISKRPDARKRMATELPELLAGAAEACEQSAAGKVGLSPPPPAPAR
jgi:hypothetical protein